MTYDAVVVGLGPCGAVASALLGLQGLTTFGFDKVRAVYDRPRALALDHEILRVFQQIGLMHRIERWIAPATATEYHGVNGQLIRRMADVDPPHPLSYPPSVVFAQPQVEDALRGRLSELSNVTLCWGEELVGLTQFGDHVLLALRSEAGAVMNVQARYAIGCDGAASTVRQLLNIDLEDLDFNEPWLVVDIHLNESGLEKVPAVSSQYCEPSRPCWYIIGVGNHRRWQFALNPGEDSQSFAAPEEVWRLLSRWITPDHGYLQRHATYRFRGVVASPWRRDRVFVAGDAAHQQPPYLGQGLCQGIRDVANLSWKLSAVAQGRCVDALLDTYGAERREHVKQFTTQLKAIGRSTFDRDPDRARARDERLLAESGGLVPTERRQGLQPRLRGGLISPIAGPANGTVFPQPWVSVAGLRARFDDAVGGGWRLVLREGAADIEIPERLRSTLPLAKICLGAEPDGIRELEGVLESWFEQYNCSAALVRPDHYVYGTGASSTDVALHFAALESWIPP